MRINQQRNDVQLLQLDLNRVILLHEEILDVEVVLVLEFVEQQQVQGLQGHKLDLLLGVHHADQRGAEEFLDPPHFPLG